MALIDSDFGDAKAQNCAIVCLRQLTIRCHSRCVEVSLFVNPEQDFTRAFGKLDYRYSADAHGSRGRLAVKSATDSPHIAVQRGVEWLLRTNLVHP
jgi:hypothetical protein